ncbi:MAG: hypothetical protein AAFX65_00310 [Cyanobacteria bacterium J06638_7]
MICCRIRPGDAERRPLDRSGPLALALAVTTLAAAAGTVLQNEAIRRSDGVHVIAIKRLGTLMGSGTGVFALGAGEALRRLTAAALMLLGPAAVLWGAPR